MPFLSQKYFFFFCEVLYQLGLLIDPGYEKFSVSLFDLEATGKKHPFKYNSKSIQQLVLIFLQTKNSRVINADEGFLNTIYFHFSMIRLQPKW